MDMKISESLTDDECVCEAHGNVVRGQLAFGHVRQVGGGLCADLWAKKDACTQSKHILFA